MINDKQFIITSKSPNCDNWVSVILSNGYIIEHQKDLRLFSNDSKNIVLIGNAWQVDPRRDTPENEINKLSLGGGDIRHEDVYDMEKTWCGRYLLIVNDWIYTDCVGTLGVFYSKENVSSSINILCDIENRKVIYPCIKRGEAPDFLPGDATCYDDVKRLLPCQILNYVTHETTFRPLLPDGFYKAIDDNKRIEVFSNYFVTSLRNMSKHFDNEKIFLALTGGRDSRTCFSLMHKAGIKFNTYTLWREGMHDGDIYIPKYIAKKFGVKHCFINRNENKFSQKRWDDFGIHTSGMAVEHEWQFYAYHQYQDLLTNDNEDIVILKNSVWECGTDYYWLRSDNRDQKIIEYMENIKNPILEKNMKSWYWMIQNDSVNKDIKINERVWWDLEGGCWLSSIEQSFDMMEHITCIQPCNSRLFLSILLGFDEHGRYLKGGADVISKKHEEDITFFSCPSLRGVPYCDSPDFILPIYTKKGLKQRYKFLKRSLKRVYHTIIR